MAEDLCTFVNGLCPDDLCVLPYGHPFTRQHRHITGTTYGSAHTSWPEQLEILRDPKQSGWHPGNHYMAPKGTTEAELIEMGWQLQQSWDKASLP